MTGFDRKTVRRYVKEPEAKHEYGPRPESPNLLDAFKPYLEERLRAGVWNARVLLRDLRERNYTNGTRFRLGETAAGRAGVAPD